MGTMARRVVLTLRTASAGDAASMQLAASAPASPSSDHSSGSVAYNPDFQDATRYRRRDDHARSPPSRRGLPEPRVAARAGRARRQDEQGRQGLARLGSPDPAEGRGKEVQGSQGQIRPRGVQEDILGAARSRSRYAGERVSGRVPKTGRCGRREVQEGRAERLEERLRQGLHPARRAEFDREGRRRGWRDLDLQGPPRPQFRRRPGQDLLHRHLPRTGEQGVRATDRPHR